jgi:spore maturation protein CgeB
MQIVIFGLSVSSSWGNGHATLWRGLIRALTRQGHRVVFFEWDAPYYAAHRDWLGGPGAELRLYQQFSDIRSHAAALLRQADVALLTSYCPHGPEATELLLERGRGLKVFYDLDTPITLERLARNERVEYLTARGLGDFDLVLSFTGGVALEQLRDVLGARRVEPLYGCVDPELHAPVSPVERYRSALSYLGTYASERQSALAELFLEPAGALSTHTFLLAGSQYPADFPWRSNIHYHAHVAPAEHAAFYSSARLNLNVTRAPMARLGYCPSGRLFEVAACGGTLLSDDWPGMDTFYQPGSELVVVRNRYDVLAAMQASDAELRAIARRARERTLDEHTVEQRARTMLDSFERARAAANAPGTRRVSQPAQGA